MKIRQFRCPVAGCEAVTSFDVLRVSRVESNFLLCDKCKRRWDITVLPGCCILNIKFVHQLAGKNPIVAVRSYSK